MPEVDAIESHRAILNQPKRIRRHTLTEIPEGPWLNIGSGATDAPHWIHIDGSWQARLSRHPLMARLVSALIRKPIGDWPRGIVCRDVRAGLGYSSSSVAVVYASHVIEHLHRDEARRFLEDVRRVLKPGGICRVVVPDVASIVQWYLDHRSLDPRPKEASSDVLMGMLGVRPKDVPRRRGPLSWYRAMTDFDQHKWMYDVEGMRALFCEAGFPEAESRPYLESFIPRERLASVEKADRVLDGAGICLESRKNP